METIKKDNLNKGQSVSIIEKGKELIVNEKFDEAIKYFNDLYEKENKNTLYLNYLGVICFIKKDYKSAADYFKKAIDLDPDNWYSYYKLGQICTIKNIDKCAIKYFTETIERNPKNTNALVNLALIFQKEDEELAIDLVRTALTIDPLNCAPAFVLGSLYMKQKDCKSAIKQFESIIEKNPKFGNGLVWYKLAIAYFKRKKSKKASEVILKALPMFKKSYLYNLLGLIFVQKLEFESAVSAFKESIKLNPNDPSPWINLADSYIKDKKTVSARLCLKEAKVLIKTEIQEAILWILLTKSYEQDDNLNYALYTLEKAEYLLKTQVELELEDFEGSESKIELLHDVGQKISTLKNKGISAKSPESINDFIS